MKKASVIDREIIHDGVLYGTVIEVAIPKKAKRRTFPGAEGENSYLHFTRYERGGMINLHVRSNDELQGKTIRAQVQVVKKTMSDGREFIYLDLFPINKRPTHWYHIFGSDKEAYSDWLSFLQDRMTIAFPLVGDTRLPKQRGVIAYSDRPKSAPSAFAALAVPR